MSSKKSMTKKTQPSNFTIFNWVNNITFDKKPWDSFTNEQKNVFAPYIIHRVISLEPSYIHIANIVQKIPHTEKEKIHNIYLNMLPKRKIFNKYIKNQSENTYQEISKHLSEYFICSLGEAEDYIDILRKEGVRSILWEMGIEEKEVDKLIKTAKIK